MNYLETPTSESRPVAVKGSIVSFGMYDVSIVVPIHNEARLIKNLVNDLCEAFHEHHTTPTYQLVLCENGSTDDSRALLAEAAEDHEGITVISLPEASYGAAMKAGILHASGDSIVVFNADLWSPQFVIESLRLLNSGSDVVIGSKCLNAGDDRRPFLRRLITRSFNRLLMLFFGFKGTDTHGIKAIRRRALLPVVNACVTSREIFDTEFVLRASQQGLSISEIGVTVTDTRPPRMSLLRRITPTLVDLFKLWFALRAPEVTLRAETTPT